MIRRTTARWATLAIALCGVPSLLNGQATPPDEGGIQLSRDALEQRLAQYEQSAESSAYSEELRRHAREEAAMLRERLRSGDLKIGDQIELRVEGEDALSSTFVVSEGPALELPTIGRIPLEGVLRSELESHLTAQIGRYIREPRVHARALFRLTVTGAVARPGFYVVPAQLLLTDALMVAGGPAPRALLDRIRVERAGEVIWEGEPLQRAITEGRTLDQLSLQAGDRIIVPESRSGGASAWLYALSGISSVIVAITAISRIF